MASIVRNARGANQDAPVVQMLVATSQTIEVGDLLQVDGTSKLLELATAASTTIVGIALEDITTGGSVTASDAILVQLVRGQVVRLDVYQGGAKDTFDQADFYTVAYDLQDELTVNPNDTTNGMCYIVANNQTTNTADVIFADAALANVG